MFSDAYDRAVKESEAFHLTHKTFSGAAAFAHRDQILRVIKRLGVETILDFGAGKGLQYEGDDSLEKFWGVPVTKYDPAWPPYAAKPVGTFDLVICTHALSFVPTHDVPAVVDWLYELADKALYVGETLAAPRKKVFTNPEAFPIGLALKDWEKILRRPDETIEVTLATLRPEDGFKVRTKRL